MEGEAKSYCNRDVGNFTIFRCGNKCPDKHGSSRIFLDAVGQANFSLVGQKNQCSGAKNGLVGKLDLVGQRKFGIDTQ